LAKSGKILKKEGKGAEKRLLYEVFHGVKNLDYMHSRKTLSDVCRRSKFKKFRVRFMNLHGRQQKRKRIAVELYR
jgi:hypothetical protein